MKKLNVVVLGLMFVMSAVAGADASVSSTQGEPTQSSQSAPAKDADGQTLYFMDSSGNPAPCCIEFNVCRPCL